MPAATAPEVTDDQTALERVFREHAPMVIRTARAITGSPEEAEDIGPILKATDLSPGLNDPFRGRVRGNYIWARLRSAIAGRRWAFERGECEIVECSTQINRST